MHVVGPQLGLTQPGMTVVCGDSHTSTHGAFGALAFGIGTSEVEHVLATQTLPLKPFKTMAITVDGAAARGLDGQGHHPRGHRADRHRRRPGLRPGVPRRGDPRPVDGGPDDRLQHVDRGRRPRRDDRPGRDDVRLPRRAARTRRRAPTGTPRSSTGARCAPTTTPSFDAEVVLDAADIEPFVTWGTNPGQGLPLSASRAGPGDDRRTRTTRVAAAARAGVHGPRRRARRCARSPSTPCSSARAPTAGSRTCGPRPPSSRAARRPTRCGCSSCPARPGSGCRPRPRGWTRSSPTSGPSGARPAARCAWA